MKDGIRARKDARKSIYRVQPGCGQLTVVASGCTIGTTPGDIVNVARATCSNGVATLLRNPATVPLCVTPRGGLCGYVADYDHILASPCKTKVIHLTSRTSRPIRHTIQ